MKQGSHVSEAEPQTEAERACGQAAADEAAAAAEMDDDSPEEVMGDCVFDLPDGFIFDTNGARVDAWHSEPVAEATEAEAGAAAAPGEAATSTAAAAGPAPAAKKTRKARKRTILTQAPGTEAGAQGVLRVETEQPREAKMFTASAYFWLYYAVAPATGKTEVPVGKLAEPGQCHGVLDDAAEVLPPVAYPPLPSGSKYLPPPGSHPPLLYRVNHTPPSSPPVSGGGRHDPREQLDLRLRGR
jgi:hypothetical protein